MTNAHSFDEAMYLEPLGDGRYRGSTSAGYANMVGPFGGAIAALMLQAPSLAPDRLGDPSALTVNFCGPVADGVFDVRATAIRTNRSNQHWTMTLMQDDQVAVAASAVFATRRPTWRHTEARCPDAPGPDSVERATNAFRPPWTQRYDMRFVKGSLPSLGASSDATSSEEAPGQEPVSWVWIADDPPRPIDYLSLAAICDAFFPRIFLRRPTWTPVGTVSLTIHFHADAPMLAAQGERPVFGIAAASHFGNGMFDEHVEVWSDDRSLLATAHQIVYFKA